MCLLHVLYSIFCIPSQVAGPGIFGGLIVNFGFRFRIRVRVNIGGRVRARFFGLFRVRLGG